jgi:hypothetical protein
VSGGESKDHGAGAAAVPADLETAPNGLRRRGGRPSPGDGPDARQRACRHRTRVRTFGYTPTKGKVTQSTAGLLARESGPQARPSRSYRNDQWREVSCGSSLTVAGAARALDWASIAARTLFPFSSPWQGNRLPAWYVRALWSVKDVRARVASPPVIMLASTGAGRPARSRRRRISQ